MSTIEPGANGTVRSRIRRQGALDSSRTFDSHADAAEGASAPEAAVRAGRLQEHQQRIATLGERLAACRDKVTPGRRGASRSTTGSRRCAATGCPASVWRHPFRQTIREYRDRRLLRVSGSTINRELALPSAVLKRAKAECDAPVDPHPLDNLKRRTRHAIGACSRRA